MKTYAYVTSECCRKVAAEKPGALIGRDEVPVAKHGDYHAWTLGKRRTLEIIDDWRDTPYMRAAARAVAELLGWEVIA